MLVWQMLRDAITHDPLWWLMDFLQVVISKFLIIHVQIIHTQLFLCIKIETCELGFDIFLSTCRNIWRKVDLIFES